MSETDRIVAGDVGDLADLEAPRQTFLEPGGAPQPNEDWLSVEKPGTEGLRSASDPDWNWSWRTIVRRRGPSDTLNKKIRELTRDLGPPPDDLEFYGEFDEPDVPEE